MVDQGWEEGLLGLVTVPVLTELGSTVTAPKLLPKTAPVLPLTKTAW